MRIILALSFILSLLATPAAALIMCQGEFALCAATSCMPTGRTITTNGGVTWPEAKCTCPVLHGLAVADPTSAGGNMQGSCSPPTHKGGVWSLFAPRDQYPQAVTGWKKAPAVLQLCNADLNLGAQTVNCFSFACTKTKRINGVEVADCRCPIGQGKDGPMPAATTFGTMAGQGNPAYCGMSPVSAPLP